MPKRRQNVGPSGVGATTLAYQQYRTQESIGNPTRINFIGGSDVRRIIESNGTLVDKTAFIGEILEGPKIQLIVGPSGFGKTLSLKVADYYLNVWGHPHFRDGIFKKFQIVSMEGGKYKQHQKRYPIVEVDLKLVAACGFADFFEELRRVMRELYRDFRKRLFDKINSEEQKRYNQMTDSFLDLAGTSEGREIVQNSLRDLISYIARINGQNVIVLIDRFDKPFGESLVREGYQEVSKFMTDFMKATLIGNNAIHRAVLAVNLPVAMDEIFSGVKTDFKIHDLFSPKAASFFGFSHTEVGKFFRNGERTHNAGITTMHEMEDYYGAIQMGCQTVFNPWSILWCLGRDDSSKYPWQYDLPRNALVRTKSDESIKMMEKDIRILMSGGVLTKIITRKVTLDKLENNPDAWWSVLLYRGFVGLKKYIELIDNFFEKIEVELVIPNREVFSIWHSALKNWEMEYLDLRFSSPASIMANRITSFLEAIQRSLFEESVSKENRSLEATAFVFALNEYRVDLDSRQIIEKTIVGLLQSLFPKSAELPEEIDFTDFLNQCKQFRTRLHAIHAEIEEKIAVHKTLPKEFLLSLKDEQKKMQALIRDVFDYVSKLLSKKIDVSTLFVSSTLADNFFKPYPEIKYSLVTSKNNTIDNSAAYLAKFDHLLEFILIALGMAPVDRKKGLLGEYAHYFRCPASKNFVNEVTARKEPLGIAGIPTDILVNLSTVPGAMDLCTAISLNGNTAGQKEYRALVERCLFSEEYRATINASLTNMVSSIKNEWGVWSKALEDIAINEEFKDCKILFESLYLLLQQVSLFLKSQEQVIILRTDSFEQLEELKNRKFLTPDEFREYSDLMGILSFMLLKGQLASASATVTLPPKLVEKQFKEMNETLGLKEIEQRIGKILEWAHKLQQKYQKPNEQGSTLADIIREIERPRTTCGVS